MTTLPRPLRRVLGALAILSLPLAGCGGDAPRPARGLVIQGISSDPNRPYYHDFGELAEGEVAAHTFELLNTDPEPVTIERLTPACTCTVGKIYCLTPEGERLEGSMRSKPVLTVPPGARVFLEFQLDTRQVASKNVDKLAIVVLACDSPNEPFLRFELHTVVTAPLQVTPTTADLKDVPQSVGGPTTVTVARALPQDAVELTGVLSASEGLEAEIERMDLLGHPAWAVTVRVEPGRPLGPVNGEVVLATTGPSGTGEGPPLRIPVRGRVVEDLVVQPGVLAFGRFEEGAARAEGLLQALVPGERVAITDAELESDAATALQVEYEALDPDALGRSPRWRVVVLAPPELEGTSFGGTLRLRVDHPTQPVVEARFVGRPR